MVSQEMKHRMTVRSSNFTSGYIYINKRIRSRDSHCYTHVQLRLHRALPMVSSQRKRRLRHGLWVVLHDTLTAPQRQMVTALQPLSCASLRDSGEEEASQWAELQSKHLKE